MCLDLAFQPFSLLCCRQPSPTNRACTRQGTPTGPQQLPPGVKSPEQITTTAASKPKEETTGLKIKQVHIKKNTERLSFKCVQLVLNINFDFQTSFLLLISPFCSKCAKSTWCPFALKQTHLGGKSSQCANLWIDFTASVLGSWCYLESPGCEASRWLSILQMCFCW